MILSSSFAVNASIKPNTNMRDIRNTMNQLPNLRLVSFGTKISYEILDNSGEEHSVLEILPDRVKIIFFFSKPNPLTYNSNLLKFLSMLAYLDRHFVIELRTLYPYVIEAIRESMFPNSNIENNNVLLEMKIEALSDANRELSAYVLEIEKRKLEEAERYAVFKKFFEDATENICKKSGYRKEVVERNLNFIGIDEATIKKATDVLTAEKKFR